MVPNRSVPQLKASLPFQRARLNTGFGEIVRVDELVGILAVTEHRDVFPLINPLEEDLKDSQAGRAPRSCRPDDRDIQTVPRVFPA